MEEDTRYIGSDGNSGRFVDFKLISIDLAWKRSWRFKVVVASSE